MRSLLSQEGRDPDYSEYKEFKLTVENLGFRMLMKMGWKEGEGLGSDSQGIKAPVNKYARLSGKENAPSLSTLSSFSLIPPSLPPSHVASLYLSPGVSQPRTGQVLGSTALPS